MEKRNGLIVNEDLIDEEGRILIAPEFQRREVEITKTTSPRMDQLLGALTKLRNKDSKNNIALAVHEIGDNLVAYYMMMTSNSSDADVLPPYLFQPGVSDISHRRKLTPNENLWHPFIYTPFGKEQEELNFGKVYGLGYDSIPNGIEVGNLDNLLESKFIEGTKEFQGFFNPLHSRVIFPLGDRGLDIDTANHTAYKISGVDKKQRFELFK